jgi:hypothetical protein
MIYQSNNLSIISFEHDYYFRNFSPLEFYHFKPRPAKLVYFRHQVEDSKGFYSVGAIIKLEKIDSLQRARVIRMDTSLRYTWWWKHTQLAKSRVWKMPDKLGNTNHTHFYTRIKEAFGYTELVTLNTRVFLGKVIPVTGRGGLQGCETSRLQHFLDNRLIDGGEVVSFTRRPPFTPRMIPGTHFC